RKWNWLVSESGQFIGCDTPVMADGPSGGRVGFLNAEVVVYPVNRYLLLFGTQEATVALQMTTKLAARNNTFAMLSADEQVYSHRSDFHWLGSNDKCQQDWKLFSKEDFLPPSENGKD